MTLADRLRELARRPQGFTVTEAGGERNSVQAACERMTKTPTRNRIYKAKAGPRDIRYFDTAERASAYVASRLKALPAADRSQPTHTRAWWLGTSDASAEPVITSRTRITVAPTPPAPTHTNTHSR